MPGRVATSWPVRPTVRYARHLAEALRAETLGGLVMLAAGVAALVWANGPWSSTYETFTTYAFGPEWFHFDVEHFASSGLLAVFFFIAGLELRNELTHGELRDPRTAVLPVVAAVAGVIAPAVVFLALSRDPQGWAVPTATDIAFALAVLAIVHPACPAPLRAFLLTLAVVDDLIAITVIALFYTDHLNPLMLLGGAAGIVAYGILRREGPWLLVPLAVAAWALVYKSGVHATVAGVALGLLTEPHERPGRDRSPAERADHLLRPVSAGLCVPLFALVSAGVSLSG